MRKYYTAIIAGGLWGIFRSVFCLKEETMMLSCFIRGMATDKLYFSYTNMMEMMVEVLPLIIFQIVYGTFLYKRFCTISVFYFSRCTKRITWFLKESFQLYIASFIYFCVIWSVTIGIAFCCGRILFDKVGLLFSCYYIVIYSLWTYITALLINLIAIKKGSIVGFVVVVIVETLGILALPLWDVGKVFSLFDHPSVMRNLFFLKCNPISHIVFKWHTSEYLMVNQYVNQLGLPFDFHESIKILIGVVVLVMAMGSMIIRNHELLSNNIEIDV